MSSCPKCHAELYPEDRWCDQCGSKLTTTFFTSGGQVIQNAMKAIDIRYRLGMIYLSMENTRGQ